MGNTSPVEVGVVVWHPMAYDELPPEMKANPQNVRGSAIFQPRQKPVQVVVLTPDGLKLRTLGP